VVYPNDIHISLDDVLSKTVPVRPQLVVWPAPGYVQVGELTFSPRSVEIAGPKDLVNAVRFVETERDTVDQAMNLIRKNLPLKSRGRLIQFSVQTVPCKVDVQAISERIIPEIPVNVTNLMPGLRVFVNPKTVSLTIVGGVDYIAGITPDDIQAVVDFENVWDPKRQFYQPEITVPAEVLKWQDLSPKNVELVVTRNSP
ncbi:MAG: CdaR family protein, partial [Fidelibacterota bacterium]